ncbi:cytochrome o ubiquinol oxidase subunit IV [Aureimonas frigidaquae]|uniref:cytochrome o ubiquinol oxidase subunit IV n=1 Tax=Aureimonas frigidaquae TaxID=424757 RepID=UPI0007864FAD|nr:cytochrome o ubiquinol oxidase subunit IV [Aureimonas frigidaquae]
MSEHTHSAHTGAEHHHQDGAHGTMKGYVIGFVLSVVLTVIPFLIAMRETGMGPQVTAFVIMGFAAVQIVVHMVYFLHMNTRSEGGWNMLALVFTLVITVIMLAGSLWVMYHLNTNMMPMDDMRPAGYTP